MERLTQRNPFGEIEITYDNKNDYHDKVMKIANRLAELEDKLESGQLVELPCKVGDTVYGVGFSDCEDGHTNDEKIRKSS